MNTKSIIEIFRGDDSDALGYQTIVGTIHTDLDLTGCKAVFRYLGFFQEFDPIPEDKKLTIVIPSASSMQFPPGLGYASLKVYDIDRKVRTFTNRIPVFVKTMTPCRGGGEFDVEFSPFPELEPLKIFKGPGAEDFDLYTGFLSKIIDRASAEKYGLSVLFDAMDAEKTAGSGYAASPAAVKAAYDAIIAVLTDNYYTAAQTDAAIERVAAYYITYNAAGAAFPTRADLLNATTYYSGGVVRVPTRNDYAVVLADEAHGSAEYRYIYAVPDGATTGQWEPQYPIETNDYTALSNKPSINSITLSGNKTAADLGLATDQAVAVAYAKADDALHQIRIIAPDWTGGSSYAQYDVVKYNGVYYYAKSDISNSTTVPSSDATHWGSLANLAALAHLFLPLTGGTMSGALNLGLAKIDDAFGGDTVYFQKGENSSDRVLIRFPSGSGTRFVAMLQDLAANYSTSATYTLNALCVYSDKLYRCTTAITTAEPWTPAHWTPATVEDVLAALRTGKATKVAGATAGNLATLTAQGNLADAGYHFEVRGGIPCIVQYT